MKNMICQFMRKLEMKICFYHSLLIIKIIIVIIFEIWFLIKFKFKKKWICLEFYFSCILVQISITKKQNKSHYRKNLEHHCTQSPKKSKEKRGLVFPSGRRPHAANKTSKNTVPLSLAAGSLLMRDKAAKLIHVDIPLSQDTAQPLLPHSVSNPVTEWHLAESALH